MAPDSPPPLLARLRWANLARLAILLAAGYLIVTGPGGCRKDPPQPPFTPPPAFPASPVDPTASVPGAAPEPEPDLGAPPTAAGRRDRSRQTPKQAARRVKAKRRLRARPDRVEPRRRRRKSSRTVATPPAAPAPTPPPADAPPPTPAPAPLKSPVPQPPPTSGQFTPDP